MDSSYTTVPVSNSVIEAIRSRRSVREFLDKTVPRESLERMLEAARWAPNHRLTFPWRFFVLEKGGEVRARVAGLAREWTYENNPQLPEPKRTQVADTAREEVLRAPAFMLVYAVPGQNEEVTRENYASAVIAMQNVSLIAAAEGLAAGWSTGRATRHGDLPAALGADASWQMAGALFIGYPAVQPKANRPEVSAYAFWK